MPGTVLRTCCILFHLNVIAAPAVHILQLLRWRGAALTQSDTQDGGFTYYAILLASGNGKEEKSRSEDGRATQGFWSKLRWSSSLVKDSLQIKIQSNWVACGWNAMMELLSIMCDALSSISSTSPPKKIHLDFLISTTRCWIPLDLFPYM